jgi:formiminotetrahydrofolate cyclodeaminase
VLDEVAARTPAPGGGSAAALACALAAALVEMAAAFNADSPTASDTRARAGELRSQLVGLAERDLESYPPVLKALALDSADPARPAALAAALDRATDVPMEIARAGAEVSTLAAQITDGASRHTTGDAATAAVLAEGACRAAAMLVEVNLRGTPDERPAQAAQCVRDADVACQRALSKAHET